MGVKRKAAQSENSNSQTSTSKKQHLSSSSAIKSAFRSDLFETSTVQEFQAAYATSEPYPHAVVPELIETHLLRSVRSEITTHIHFTLKETDIYRIHQSGDLANLSNLDGESLKHLPSLVQLRDALYSHDFREWVSDVTGAGKLSGQKTDMAVNVYTPGSYLLCHDDVIGSRRVSYILYLTDPDRPWRPEWGGGLRLYSTESKKNANGEDIKVPLADHILNIPPSFGQLSFFTVVPGESYHDVEEVYHGQTPEEDKGRIRMAISGWYHIPQEGEDGYEEGLEQSLAQKSSLTQLKGAANEFDEPLLEFRHFDEPRVVMNSHATAAELDPGQDMDEDTGLLTEQDLTFLLQYIRAQYLAPDMIDEVSASFEETSILQLEQFLNDKFAKDVREHIEACENNGKDLDVADDPSRWKVARPPHKHRYAYAQEDDGTLNGNSPISKLLSDLMHSHAFKKWLALATGLKTQSLTRQHAVARRFRRGQDYALASTFQGEQPQLEFTISLTPSTGWDQEQDGTKEEANGQAKSNGVHVDTSRQTDYGGEEVYMAGDEEGQESSHSKFLPQVGKKADPAVYRAADEDEEDSILFANVPTWNQLSVVLRDKGTLRFVKYVSEAARGDRWDIKGEVELADDAFDQEDDDIPAPDRIGHGSNGQTGDSDSEDSEDVDEDGDEDADQEDETGAE